MNVQFKCHHFECPDDVREAIEAKHQRFTPLVPETTYMEVELHENPPGHHGATYRAEVLVDIPGVKPVIRFVAEGSAVLEAVDLVFDKLDTELSKRKDRQTDHSYHGDPPKEQIADQLHNDALTE